MSKHTSKAKGKRSRSKHESSIVKSQSAPTTKRRKVSFAKRAASAPPLQAREGAPSPDSIKMPPPARPVKKTGSNITPKDDRLPRLPPPAKLSTRSDPHVSLTPDSASVRTSISSSKSTSPLISTKALRKSSQDLAASGGKATGSLIPKLIQTSGDRKEILVFKPPRNLGTQDWPEISFGSKAPLPRWRLKEDDQNPEGGRDLSVDLIKTHQTRTHVKMVLKGDRLQSGDSGVGLGALLWEFEPGSSKLRKGLSKEHLYEFAYLCLFDALSDFRSRDLFREAIARANFKSIRNVEDPLPSPPPPPKFTHLGKDAGIAEWAKRPTKIHDTSKPYFGNQYLRPSTAIRGGQNTGNREEEWLISRMMYHHKGTQRPGEISRSRDPYLLVEQKNDFSDGDSELPTPSIFNHEGFDAEKQDMPTDTSGRLARMSKDKHNLDKGPHVFFADVLRDDDQPNLHTAPSDLPVRDLKRPIVRRRSVPGSKSPRASRYKAFGPAKHPRHKHAIRKSDRLHPSEVYYYKCKKICEDPEKRKLHFPEPSGTRRVRTWAGEIISEADAAVFREKLPGHPRTLRPFSRFRSFND